MTDIHANHLAGPGIVHAHDGTRKHKVRASVAEGLRVQVTSVCKHGRYCTGGLCLCTPVKDA